jgi:hypothetical protein
MCWMFSLKDACTVLTYFWIKVKNDVGMLECKSILKGPKHDQVECGFFYTNQTRMVR